MNQVQSMNECTPKVSATAAMATAAARSGVAFRAGLGAPCGGPRAQSDSSGMGRPSGRAAAITHATSAASESSSPTRPRSARVWTT